jgi:hypothetical protein
MATPTPTRKDEYKVNHGPPRKNPTELKKYMEDRDTMYGPNLDTIDKEQKINNQLLQIISKGIDNIVIDLKTKLGTDFESTNTKASDIKQILDDLKNRIDIGITTIGTSENNILDARQINFDINSNSWNVSNDSENPGFYSMRHGAKENDINVAPTYKFANLDTNHQNVIPNQDNFFKERETDNKAEIENRLRNCQNLEFLYLKKHDEIMKIFAFTVNLFDKYKYAIKVILFLLKNLVYKDPITGTSTGTSVKIDLPLPIISNIKKLVDDQNSVQGIINDMKKTLDNENTFDDTPKHDSENILNEKIFPTPPQPAPTTAP